MNNWYRIQKQNTWRILVSIRLYIQVIYGNINQLENLIFIAKTYYSFITDKQNWSYYDSNRKFFLFPLLPVTCIHLIIYPIIFLIIQTRWLICLVLLKPQMTLEKPQIVHHISRLYGPILPYDFINNTFQFKLMFSSFIVKCFLQYNRECSYLLIHIAI